MKAPPNFILTENGPRAMFPSRVPQKILWEYSSTGGWYERRILFTNGWRVTSCIALFRTYEELVNPLYPGRKIIDTFNSVDEFVAKYFVELL